MEIQHVTVLGTGVLGSQIAYQTAFSGFQVVAYDISDEALEQAHKRFTTLAGRYVHDQVPSADERATATADQITLSSDLATAVRDADLVIEAAPELIEIKRKLYEQLAEAAPAHTIFATNSSTLLPSDLKGWTGRPDRFLALHFANEVWKFNTAEVMGTADTDPEVFATVSKFATAIGMVPIELHKEKAGYVLNSLLVPLLDAAQDLVVFGYASLEDVDKTWRIATGAPAGPFQILDVVGLTTAYNIAVSSPDEKSQKVAAWMKANYIDKGKLGVATGEGFYKYDY